MTNTLGTTSSKGVIGGQLTVKKSHRGVMMHNLLKLTLDILKFWMKCKKNVLDALNGSLKPNSRYSRVADEEQK